jgi:signal transduction histidine kinase
MQGHSEENQGEAAEAPVLEAADPSRVHKARTDEVAPASRVNGGASSGGGASDDAGEGAAEGESEPTRVVETRVVETRSVHTRVVEAQGDHVLASEGVATTSSSTLSQQATVGGQEMEPQVSRERVVESHGALLEGHVDEDGRLHVDDLHHEPREIDASLERAVDPTTSPPSIPVEIKQALHAAAEASPAGAPPIEGAQGAQGAHGGAHPPAPDARQVLAESILASSGLTAGLAGVEEDERSLRERLRDMEVALDHRERQIRAMQETAERLLSHDSVDAMVKTTLDLAIGVLEAQAGSLLLHNAVTDTLIFRYVVGPAADTLIGFTMPATQGIAGQVFKSGIARVTHKVAETTEHNREVDAKTGYQTESMMTAPLKRAEGDSIGVMQILNSAQPFDERDLEVLQVMAAQASASIENARLVQEARKAEIVNVIGDISHDIKNMLTPIQSGVWTLEPMLDEMFRALDTIKASSDDADLKAKLQGAEDLVREDYGWILSAALDAAEKVQMRTKEIADAVKGESAAPAFMIGSVNEVAEEVARSLRLVVLDAKLDLETDFDPALPQAEFDHKQVYNALYNLVNNAIPETPEGGSITIRTRAPDAEDPNSLIIQIQDTGKGMPPHVRARLFTDEAISTKPGGTGLGTRIVGGVVKRHNGKIAVDSEPGEGTTFTIRLPLRHK